MLEDAGALKTWAMPNPPEVEPEADCDELPDHRLAYLDYEGTISGGRGEVTRWDDGTYAILEKTDDAWHVELAGRRFAGRAVLRRSPHDPRRWRFTCSQESPPVADAGG